MLYNPLQNSLGSLAPFRQHVYFAWVVREFEKIVFVGEMVGFVEWLSESKVVELIEIGCLVG